MIILQTTQNLFCKLHFKIYNKNVSVISRTHFKLARAANYNQGSF